jgi:hypothetical protein
LTGARQKKMPVRLLRRVGKGFDMTKADILDQETSHNSERKRCRNLHCRMKLPAPVDNEHQAFCCRGCYKSFYLNRCRVCEADLRKRAKRGDAHRLYCRLPKNCRGEAQKWPEKYAYGLRAGFYDDQRQKCPFHGH